MSLEIPSDRFNSIFEKEVSGRNILVYKPFTDIGVLTSVDNGLPHGFYADWLGNFFYFDKNGNSYILNIKTSERTFYSPIQDVMNKFLYHENGRLESLPLVFATTDSFLNYFSTIFDGSSKNLFFVNTEYNIHNSGLGGWKLKGYECTATKLYYGASGCCEALNFNPIVKILGG